MHVRFLVALQLQWPNRGIVGVYYPVLRAYNLFSMIILK